jgi:MFS family permease
MNSDDRASTVQFVVNERQDAYSVTKILALLCVVASLEGADNALLPSTIEALIESLGITYWHMGILAVCQAFIQALSAPLWGIMASRGIMDRKKILIIGCIAQGAATVVLSQVKKYPMMIPIRMINGMCLASLRPISYGIVADIIAPERQGKAFGAVMMTNIIGNAIGFLICTPISRVHYTIAGMEVVGWQLAFIGIGGFSMLLGPLLAVTLSVPPVKVGAGAGQTSIADEFRALGQMLSMPTFAALVLQGCFGAIPWQAGTFKTAFFQKIGINDVQSALLGTVGGFAGAAGSLFGGFVGDFLSQLNQIHGRIFTAELSVMFGIPIAYFNYMVFYGEGSRLWIYLSLVVAQGLLATWAATGTNPPILVSVSDAQKRSLVLAWCSALEGAVAASGSFWVGYLAEAFGASEDSGAEPLGKAMFWVHLVPWVICCLWYTSLHWAYPRDLARIAEQAKISPTEQKEKLAKFRTRGSTMSGLADANTMSKLPLLMQNDTDQQNTPGLIKRNSANSTGPVLLARTSEQEHLGENQRPHYGTLKEV